MSSFVTFALSSELKRSGFQPRGHSIKEVATACAGAGITSIAELEKVNTVNVEQLRRLSAEDRMALEAHITILRYTIPVGCIKVLII